MWYAISKFMKWDMLSRICDVVWNDGWSLKYGLYTYMRTISLNVNWQLCDRKMKWSMHINVMLCMNRDMMWSEYIYGINWWFVIWVWYGYGNVLYLC